jgi:hypothetical protein
MRSFESPHQGVLAKDDGKILIVEKVHDLLPLSFSGNDLKKNDPAA